MFTTRAGLCGFATGLSGLATCFGSMTVTVGSGVAEPIAVCDTAVPLRPLSNAIDRMAITKGATELDDNLMMVSSRTKTDFAVPMCTTPRTLARISELDHLGLQIFSACRRYVNQENAGRSLEV